MRNVKPRTALGDFTRSYLETALWSSTDESRDDGGDPLDKNYDVGDFSPEAIEIAERDCKLFFEAQSEAFDLAKADSGEYTVNELAGHDFWLTRNGHGAGFWDGDWTEPHATLLTDAAKAFGETDVYVGDDGALYFSR